MYTLYIDTHFVDLVLVLYKDATIIDKIIINNANHSDIAVNLINDLLTRNKIEVANLKNIIVINGPGSFTGVRIGIVIAKIMGYTQDIALKPISYLQALSLSIPKEAYLGLKDKNGVFIGHFNSNHELLEDYFYLTNQEFATYSNPVILDAEIDYQKVLNFCLKMPNYNVHTIKPLYVKKIEVLNDKRS